MCVERLVRTFLSLASSDLWLVMASPASPIQPADIAWPSACALAVCVCLSIAGCAAVAETDPAFAAPAAIALGSTDEPTASAGGRDREHPADLAPLSEQQQRQLQVFGASLLSASADIDAETRRSAAQELLAMNRPESLKTIQHALGTRTPAIMLAVIGAMQASKPVADLLAPAVAALPGAPSSVIEPLSWVIARHGEPAVGLIAPLAGDQSAPLSARLGPIRALGAFDSQSAAAALMQILSRDNESAEITLAACESLQSVTGLSYGSDVRQWRLWWTQARDLPTDEWSAFINQSLSKRAAQLQQDLQRQRETSDRIARELFNAYRDLYPTLAVDEQLRRLGALLHDPLPPLREFAISRIALLLRDSVHIPADLQHKLAERLSDDVPALRIDAAKLLDELNYEGVASQLAARLKSESTPAVVAAYLDILSRRATDEVIESARRWLGDGNLGPKAANAIWRALAFAAVPADRAATLRTDVRMALAERQTPANLRLLALIGDEKDLEWLTGQLDGENAAFRAAIAEGLCQRGVRQPLIARVADPAILPFALRAFVEGPADLTSLGRLVAVTPTDANREAWTEACLKICDRLLPRDLLAADDLLASAPAIDPRVRAAVLARATSLPDDELVPHRRLSLIARYAAVLMVQGEAGKAHALLESTGCSAPETSELCFQAAALSGHYDKASQVHHTAAAWVALLVDVASRDLTQAAPLLDEITRRFEGRLKQQEQEQVDRIARLLREAAASASVVGPPFSFRR